MGQIHYEANMPVTRLLTLPNRECAASYVTQGGYMCLTAISKQQLQILHQPNFREKHCFPV